MCIRDRPRSYLASLLRHSDLLAKNRKFFLAPSHLAPCLEWTPSNLWKSFTDHETRNFQAADGEDLVILACIIFEWSTRVTNGQTDEQTELQWLRCAKTVAAFAHKNEPVLDGINYNVSQIETHSTYCLLSCASFWVNQKLFSIHTMDNSRIIPHHCVKMENF